jgi:hypothetical protein
VVVGSGYPFTGAAFVFTGSGGTWAQQAELTDGAHYDDFGRSVAISGPTVVVGAWGHNSRTGAAYVYAQSGSTWPLQTTLTAGDGTAFDDFGYSVAISGPATVVVGAPGTDSSIGVAYVFKAPGGTWAQQAELAAADAAVGDQFGYSVAVSGPTTAVGAPYKTGTGAAYAFEGA